MRSENRSAWALSGVLLSTCLAFGACSSSSSVGSSGDSTAGQDAEVVLRLEGTSESALDLRINGGNAANYSERRESVSLPFVKVFHIEDGTRFPLHNLSISATVASGDLTCTIEYKGRVVDQQIARGKGAQSNCEKKLGPG